MLNLTIVIVGRSCLPFVEFEGYCNVLVTRDTSQSPSAYGRRPETGIG